MNPEEEEKIATDIPDAGSSPDEGADSGVDAKEETSSSSGDGTEQGAKDGEDSKPTTLKDIVESVVNESKDTGKEELTGKSPDPEDGKQDETSAGTEEGSSPDELADEDKDEDGKPLPFHTHPRWQEMKAQRDELKTQAEAFKANAEQFEQVQSFMTEKNLNAEEVGQGFQVMDMIKNDPESALQYLEGAVGVLRQSLGKELPSDLKEAVDYGQITEDKALELSEARAQSAMYRQSAETATQQAAAQEQHAQVQQQAIAVRSAVGAWEDGVKKSDLDYPKKSDAVLQFAKAIRADRLAQGNPVMTPEQAVEVVKEAYERVNKTFRSTNSKAATPATPTGSVSAKTGQPGAPKTLLEAVKMGAQKAVVPRH